MSSLLLHNTLTREKSPVTNKNITLYTCGPTVYNYAHIGNLRTYMFEDLLKRALLFLGYRVKHVMNITDVDDKTIRGAIASGQSLDAFCSTYQTAFAEDLASLRILPADAYPKATEHIPGMIRMIETLLKKGHAYKSPDGSIYFSIASYRDYGKLSGLSLEGLQHGASNRLEDEYDKDHASDFVLWKAHNPDRDGAIFWESPFGRGRPGWHIECSCMCLEHLGDTIDIHCGGVDNIFPHHENEIAQSECYTGKPFVHLWCHAAHLIVDGKKMSKSKNNFYTLRDLLEKGHAPATIRYLLLHVHYRAQLNFTFEGLSAANASLRRIRDCIYRLEKVEDAGSLDPSLGDRFLEKFREALADDLNISLALSALFDLIREANLLMDQTKLSQKSASHLLAIIKMMDSVFGFCFFSEEKTPKTIIDALEKREEARRNKHWEEADRLRDVIHAAGYLIEDTPSGARVKKQS
ncbi:MAG: cysteine--tRNA ligase [Chlamydiota bacterium]